MAHQTGIKASPELREFLARALSDRVRLLKVVIKDEMLVADKELSPNKDWEGDFDDSVPGILDDDSPCYMFYRFDRKNGSDNYVWLFMAYTPDTASVRDKMLYAATQATMKQEFGGGLIKEEMSGSVRDDFTLKGYYEYRDSVDAPPPLTEAEQLLQDIHVSEQAMRNSDNKQKHVTGISFPFKKEASEAVRSLQNKQLDYVQLALDIQLEEIGLSHSERSLDLTLLPTLTPGDSPRFHLVYFPHSHDGDQYQSVVFVYTCPGYSCSVKERMLYSSCKSQVTGMCEQEYGVTIAKKIETDDVTEITREYLINEIHPAVTAFKAKFSKPKPPGRGTKRTIKGAAL